VPPTLLVQAKDDPVTPRAGAQQMRRLFAPSRVLTSGGGNHTQYLIDGNPCVDTAVSAYLRTGVLPVRDVHCPAPKPGI
jgi:pimeloyl-ACP methyl ester carboxylesterase